jgi:lipopolysaccharide export system permease protein
VVVGLGARGAGVQGAARPQAALGGALSSVSTLDRYLLREWTKVFLLAALGFPFLVMVIDLTDKLSTYLGRGISKARVAGSYLYYLPETISLVAPVAVLFAVVFTVGTLGRHSELTAAKASGISFHRVVRPLLIASLAAVLLDVGLTELAPWSSARRAELLGEKQIRSTASRYNFVYRADGGWVYAIRSLEIGTRELRDLIMQRGGTGEDYPTIVIAAQRAVYDTARTQRGWTLNKGAVRYLLGPGRETTFDFDTLRTKALRETPADLLAEPKAPDEMRYAELGRYVDALSRSGSDTKKLRVERALKLSVPFACIVIALFGAPLAISTPRSGTAWGVAVCLATTFVDLLMFQLSKAVGGGGALPPTFAAWVPNVLFGGAGLWLWTKVRT